MKTFELDYVMLVDDNDFDQRMYKRIIDRSGLVDQLLQYTDPEEALEYLIDPANPMPDLVLLDINMPNINGFEFLEIVTEQVGDDMCPVIVMLTTSLDPSDQARAAQFDVVRDFLNKPLTQMMLEHLVSISRDRAA